MKKKTLKLLTSGMVLFTLLAGCTQEQPPMDPPAEVSAEKEEEPAAEPTKEPEAEPEAEEADTAEGVAMKDRSGNDIMLPLEVESIISMSPATTRALIDMGYADKIVASDTNSQNSYGLELADDVLYMDMMSPDQEQIVALSPDIVFTSGMSSSDGNDAYANVRAAGLCVADIPSSPSIKDVEDDLLFIGKCIGDEAAAQKLVDEMEETIAEVKEIAATIPEEEKKTVLFELFTPSADYPTIYTAGPGTYINEMLDLVGAINIAGNEDAQWPALTEEAAVAADPQVILSADMYTPDVINTILKMKGWENVSAIKSGDVYMLDADEVNQPCHRIINALVDMAVFIYPEYFEYDEGTEELKPAA